jgi:hypothetical protein
MRERRSRRAEPSSRAGRLALAIVGLSIAIACSGNTTSPSPQPTPVPPPLPAVTPLSTVLLWPLAGSHGRDWVINNYVDLDPTSGILDYTGATGSGVKTYDGHLECWPLTPAARGAKCGPSFQIETLHFGLHGIRTADTRAAGHL